MADGSPGRTCCILLDFEADPPPPVAEVSRPAAQPSDLWLVADAVIDLARIPFGQLSALGDLARTPCRSLTQLRRSPPECVVRRQFPAERTSSPAGVIGPHRRWTWTSVDLDDANHPPCVRGHGQRRHRHGIVTSGLRQLLLDRGEPLDGLTVRSLIPV